MKIQVKRIAKKPLYTIGKLYIDGKYFCDTIEDKDRGLTSTMSTEEIASKKVYSLTAIPAGTYKVTLEVASNKYSNFTKYPWAKEAKGKIPRLIGVKGFEGILIHPGTDQNSSAGCLIVGQNKVVGKVINSQVTWKALYKELLKDKANITLTIG